MPIYSLAHLTALSLAPPDLIYAAARTGYQKVGVRMIRVNMESPGYPLMDDPVMLRDTKRAIADTGVGVWDIEFVKLMPESDIAALEPFLAAGAEVGARQVVAAPYDPDLSRLTDRFAALCDLAKGYNLGVVLEFFPWTVVRDLADATVLVDGAGRDNGGILVDLLHFDRSNSTVEQIDRVSPRRFPFVQLCDVPALHPTTLEGLLHNARAERLPPGEGELDILGVLSHLPKDIPFSLEVPMEALTKQIGPEAVALKVREAATRLLG